MRRPEKYRLMWLLAALVLACLGPGRAGLAQETAVSIQADRALVDSGLLRFVLPRFSLKTGINVTTEPIDEPPLSVDQDSIAITDAKAAGARGVPLLQDRSGKAYALLVPDAPGPQAARLASWLQSETGRRTIAQFTVDGAQPFTPASPAGTAATQTDFAGDAANGRAVSLAKCGRCHVIGEENRMKGIGSTPSFGALRALADWDERFQTFYVRNPHPAVVQVSGITTPFTAANPSPIAPLELSQDELADLLAFVAALAPADLGSPIVHQ